MNTRAVLKGYFNTGDTPTEAQFTAFIESVPNITDDFAGFEEKFYTQDIVVDGTVQDVTIVPADAASYFIMTEVHAITMSQTGTAGQPKVIDLYYNSVDQNVLNDYYIGTGVGYYGSYLVNKQLFTGVYDLIVHCEALPTGLTACTIKVIIKGFKVTK